MFISSSENYGLVSDHNYKILDNIRKSRPWTGIYNNINHTIMTSYTKKYLLDNNKGPYGEGSNKYGICDNINDYNDIKLYAVDRGGYLKCDSMFIFKIKNTDISIDQIKIKTHIVSNFESTISDVFDYSYDDGVIHHIEEDGILIYESKNFSYPYNFKSDQIRKYYFTIDHNPDIIEFIGLSQTVLKFDIYPSIWWGPKQEYYYSTDYELLTDKHEKLYIDTYCICAATTSPKDVAENDNIYSTDCILEHCDIMDSKLCDFFMSIYTVSDTVSNTVSTIIDSNIHSILGKFNNLLVLPGELACKFDVVDRMRVLKYEQNVASSPHTDGAEFSNLSTHRILIYLCEDFVGGLLKFMDDTERVVVPKKGKAVIFNLNAPHYAEAVTSGVKYIITGELIRKN